MDDIFQILIYLVIIISFLSSLFKKKTPPQHPERRVPQDRIPDAKTQPVPEYQQKADEADILKEIEKMFKTEAEKQTPAPPLPVERERIKEPDKKKRDYSEQTVVSSEHVAESVVPELNRRKPVAVDSNIEAEAKRFEAYLENRSAKHEEATRNFIRKLKNPQTFREYILVSEILSRPKALRR